MKTYQHPCGHVLLAIPDHWVEDEEDDGVAVYYEDRPGSGTFRVRVMTYAGHKRAGGREVKHILAEMANKLTSSEPVHRDVLPDGKQTVSFLRSYPDDDPPILLVTWLVGYPMPPQGVVIACYTWTALPEDAGTPESRAEFQLIEGVIRSATYAAAQYR